jgi:opacity protein-like surface antigen
MKQIIPFLILASISFSALSDEGPWSGFSVGLKGGNSKSSSTLENKNYPDQHYFVNEGDQRKISKNSGTKGVFFDYLIQSNNYVYGVEIQHLFDKNKSSTTGEGSFDTNTYSVSMSRLNTISAKTGYLIDKESLVYVKVGLARAKFKTEITEPTYEHIGISSANQNGLLLGIGFNQLIVIEGEKLILGLSYENHSFKGKTHSGQDLSGFITQHDVHVKPKINTLNLSIAYKF